MREGGREEKNEEGPSNAPPGPGLPWGGVKVRRGRI
jgi:hypothetical protein